MLEQIRALQNKRISLSVKEAASLTGDSDRAVWKKIHNKQFPYRKLGKRVYILRDELEAFFTALPGVTVEEAIKSVAKN